MAGSPMRTHVGRAVLRTKYLLDLQSPADHHEVPSLVAGHTIGGRPSRVILTTVRQRIGFRSGRADHASR
jgi:hypothetical protein